MRRAVVALLLVVVAGAAALLVVAAREERTLAFTLGVTSSGVVGELRPGAVACQEPVATGAAFDAVELHVGTFRRDGQPLRVTVRDLDGERLGAGELAGGYGDNARPVVPVGDVPDERRVSICVRNEGRRRIALYGGGDLAARTSTAEIDGRAVGADLDLVFRTEPRSTLSLVPDMLARAALFRGGWIGAWLLWALFAAVLLAVPALLARALRDAAGEPDRAAARDTLPDHREP